MLWRGISISVLHMCSNETLRLDLSLLRRLASLLWIPPTDYSGQDFDPVSGIEMAQLQGT